MAKGNTRKESVDEEMVKQIANRERLFASRVGNPQKKAIYKSLSMFIVAYIKGNSVVGR